MAITMTRKTPGVYVTELAAFPPTVVPIATAVPAFIGYTAQAQKPDGKSATMKPVHIKSLADFVEIFGGPFPPQFELTTGTAEAYDISVQVADSTTENYYDLAYASGSATFNLYYSLCLFYANCGGSGGDCWVVSVGSYTDTISKDALLGGLSVIEDQVEPTMLVVPDAVLLSSSDDFFAVAQAMLAQCKKLKSRVALLDVYGGEDASSTTYESVVSAFRTGIGSEHMSYGISYFPFLKTSVAASTGNNSLYTYQNLTEAGLIQLQQILTWENINLYGDGARALEIEAGIGLLSLSNTPEQVKQLNRDLAAALPVLANLELLMADLEGVLPPSGALAGIYAQVDANLGVWNAPANISLTAVKKPTLKLDDDQQGDLNLPVDGKAVNALREFTGRGTVVWGARTLDGNSNDYRYVQVRRTLIYIEQSIKAAMEPFVFAANDGNTWTNVVAMTSNFLQGLWSQGGLFGATAAEAFTVQCGLGSTMTAQDILNGYMIVQVTLQLIRPAEFIELTFTQAMAGA